MTQTNDPTESPMVIKGSLGGDSKNNPKLGAVLELHASQVRVISANDLTMQQRADLGCSMTFDEGAIPLRQIVYVGHYRRDRSTAIHFHIASGAHLTFYSDDHDAALDIYRRIRDQIA